MTSYELLEGFPFRYVSDPGRIIYLNSVARGLLEMFYLCVEAGESAALLTWPSRAENVAILHALSELQQIVNKAQGVGKPEPLRLCTYFWPWNQNADIVQKRILVDRTELTEKNYRFLPQLNDYPQGRILPSHTAFHVALNSIKDLNPDLNIRHTRGHHSILQKHPELTHPTLFEITPQVVFQSGTVKNLPLAKNCFLKRSQKYIRTSLSDERLFQIDAAPFFMIGIPDTCTSRDLCHGDLFAARRPNIVLIDLTNVYSRIGKNWQKQVVELFSLLVRVFSANENGIPPILAITEDPIVFNKLTFSLLADYEEKRRQKRNVYHFAILNVTQSLFDERSKVDANSPVPSIMVASFAEDMVDVFLMGQELRNKVREIGSNELAEKIDILNHTLRNVINMPGGMDDYMVFLEEYCDETGLDIQFIAIKPVAEWIKVKELVDRGAAGAERVEAEEYLRKSRVIIDGLKKSTPLQSRLEVLYQKLEEKPENNAVVFPNKQMKAFAEWMRSHRMSGVSFNGDSETRFVFFDARQALDLSRSLLSKIDNVYLVLPRQKYLSQMLAQKEIPPNLSFVCDGGTVLSLLCYVGILEKVPGLEIIGPRLTVLREALERAAGSRVSLPGELDEMQMIANALIFNLREFEPGHYQGHPVVVITEEGARISAYEGSDILQYQEENDLQPFSKATVSQLQEGDKFFVITSEFLDAASDKINITAMASESLRAYHARIVERVREIRGGSLREKAEAIHLRMKDEAQLADIGEGENVNNIIRWINVAGLLELPRELVKPHAPKIRKVFKLFMKALGVSEGEIDWYWAAAIQSTRKVRIRAGLDRNRVFYKLLLDPTSVEQFFHGDKGDLRNLIDIACRNVFTVSHIVKEHDDEHPQY